MALSERPRWSLALLAVLLTLAVLGLLGDAPQDRLQDDSGWSQAQMTREEFELDWDAGFLAIFGDVTGPAEEAAVRAMVERVEALPWVADVSAPWDLPGLSGASLQEASTHELVGGTLVGPAGALFPLTLEKGEAAWASFLYDSDPDWRGPTREAAQEALDASGGQGLEVGMSGLAAVVEAQGTAFEGERWRFMGFGALLGFLIASAAFRNVRATFLAGLPPVFGVVLSVGLARFVGLGADGFTTIVLPLLVLTIGFADSLHLVVGMVKARSDGHAEDGASAASFALGELVWPCALTSLTTAIGFASLSLAGHSLVVEFGLSCALATAITFVAVILVTPLLARTPLGGRLDAVRPPRFDGEASGGAVRALVDASLRRPRLVAVIGLAATVASVAVASGLRADRLVMTDLAEGSEAARTLQRVDREMGGVFPIQVRLDWEETVSSAEIREIVEEVERAMGQEPLFAGVVGPAGILRAIGPAASWDMLRLVPERWRKPFIDLETRRALVHARVPDAGSAALIPAFERTRERLVGIVRPGCEIALVGDHVAYLETVDDVTRDLAWSLALAAVLILVTLALAFRSWRLGLASVVPNLLPLGVSAAGLALTGGHVDVSTLTALTLSLGIATDDTIHVLARWERTRIHCASAVLAARAAILRTLPALTMTTLTLTAAFGQLLTSALPTIRDFGLLAGITLVVAFLADVLLLPSILVVLDAPGGRTEG
ncbi:MMPL family transporter [Planctomycetes bacterium Poly30]|uniref:efflux RND transporter permease subunit n=1 Tax=Saltatorellus ferox TaxID=2528018 RepID=UPI00119E0BB9